MLRVNDVKSSELDTMPALNLINLYMFQQLLDRCIKRRAEYERVANEVNTVSDVLILKYPKIADEILRLRLDIRLELRGTPVTEPMDSLDPRMHEDSHLTEAQYAARTLLLKRAYKAVAQVTHPDREGGSEELFKQTGDALKYRDLDELNYIYVNAVHVRNLYWRNSSIGHEYIGTTSDKYCVRLELLRKSTGFAIVRHYRSGRIQLAQQMMQQHLEQRVLELMMELDYIRAQNVKKRKEGERKERQERQLQERRQENKSGYRRDGRCPRSESGWQRFRQREQEIKAEVQAQAIANLGRT